MELKEEGWMIAFVNDNNEVVWADRIGTTFRVSRRRHLILVEARDRWFQFQLAVSEVTPDQAVILAETTVGLIEAARE